MVGKSNSHASKSDLSVPRLSDYLNCELQLVQFCLDKLLTSIQCRGIDVNVILKHFAMRCGCFFRYAAEESCFGLAVVSCFACLEESALTWPVVYKVLSQ